ncbi:CHY zinc finger protein [Piscibacillus salipiscarius]|uniref:CHY zinc finger protein n=1 Tax=Piscibacillus salipiscarius TaxID=299480 RepID=A0ABW5QBW3_9BACI|nr:CHY zinc finger protein [Piscibacillus salipiscarius]
MEVFGSVIDKQTRCKHYHSKYDVIAIKFKCCNAYYPCYKCHEESVSHSIERWEPEEFNQKAVLCGICRHELTVNEYLNSANQCPNCQAKFNPGCQLHHDLYFKV